MTVNDNAAAALRSDRAVSLLPVGVTAIDGEWEEGDIITLTTDGGEVIGVGRAALGSGETAAMIGQRGGRPVVHYDYLFIE